MDLICCAQRTRRRTSLFEDRRLLGNLAVAEDESESWRSSRAPEDTAPLDPHEPGSQPRRGDEEQSTDEEGEKAPEPKAGLLPAAPDVRGDDGTSSTTSGMPDPFLLEGLAEAEEAPVARLKHLAAQICGEVRLRHQPARKSCSGFLPPTAPRTLHMELLPSTRGLGLEPWVVSEIALWESEEACAMQQEPLASAKLTRITKVKHLDKHHGGCSVRLRLQQADSHEACEEILVFASSQQAKGCSEALVECINIVRASVGRSIHAPTPAY